MSFSKCATYLVLLVAVAFTAASVGQPPATGAEAPITYGFDERFRFEGYNNADFNSAKADRLNQLRMRTRLFSDINFNEYLEGYVRMGWEGIKRTTDSSYPVGVA